MIAVNQNASEKYRGHVVAVSGAGYGFIMAEDRAIDRDVYFHVSDIIGNSGRDGNHLNKNERVKFRLSKTERGFRARLIERETIREPEIEPPVDRSEKRNQRYD
jgi:cold shock CspA family protein